MSDLQVMTDVQRDQRIAELRARLQNLYAFQMALELTMLEFTPRAGPGPVSSRCYICGRGTPHEHTVEEQVIFRNGLKAGRQQSSDSASPVTTENNHGS